jgi:hypothetical protein
LRKGRRINYDDAKLSITKPPKRQTELMKTQMSIPRTTTPQTANHMTAEGKMKAPTGMPELSLQDVFPDSVNLIGSHQKTIRLFESEQEKGAQLLKEKGEKKPKIQIRRKEKTQNDRIRINQ